MTGVATPLLVWFAETKAHEMTSDLQPFSERLLPTPAATP
jgi:hypothetical protein